MQHAHEAALISGEHGDEPANRIGECSDEIGDEFEFRRKLRELVHLRGVHDLSVDVRGLDGDLLDGVAERLERLCRRHRVGPGEDDSGRTGEERLELRGQIAGGDAEERVLDDRIGVAVLAKLAAQMRDFRDGEARVIGQKQVLRAGELFGSALRRRLLYGRSA